MLRSGIPLASKLVQAASICRTRLHDAANLPLAIKLVKFATVGLSGVGVNLLFLFLLYERASLPLLVASPLAVEASIASNFVLNNHWTFGKSRLTAIDFFKFNLISLGGLVITTGALYALHTLAGMYYVWADLVGIGLATGWNFSLNVLWTWRQP